MPLKGGWLRDQYSRLILLKLGYSRKLRDEKNSPELCKNVPLSFKNGSTGRSTFCPSAFIDTGKGMNVKPNVFHQSFELCGKPKRLCKTTCESLFLNYQGGSAMPGGELRTKDFS